MISFWTIYCGFYNSGYSTELYQCCKPSTNSTIETSWIFFPKLQTTKYYCWYMRMRCFTLTCQNHFNHSTIIIINTVHYIMQIFCWQPTSSWTGRCVSYMIIISCLNRYIYLAYVIIPFSFSYICCDHKKRGRAAINGMEWNISVLQLHFHHINGVGMIFKRLCAT